VLVDSEVLALEVELAVLREQGLTFDRADYINRFMGLSYEAFHDVMDEEAEKQIGRRIADDIRQDLASRLRQTMIEKLTAIPGAGEAVADVTLPKAVASSSTRDGLERKLRQVGLWEHFAPHVYSAEHVIHSKPAPDLFLHAASALGVSPRDCLVLEDSVNGVTAAHAAGMRVWGFMGGGHMDEQSRARLEAAKVERVIEDWAHFTQALSSLA